MQIWVLSRVYAITAFLLWNIHTSALSCICDYCLPTVEHPYKCSLVYMWLLPSYCGTSIQVLSRVYVITAFLLWNIHTSALSCICDYCLPTVEHPYKCSLVYMWLLPSYCGTSIQVLSRVYVITAFLLWYIHTSALSCICDYCLPTVVHPYKCSLVYMWLLPSYCGTSIQVLSRVYVITAFLLWNIHTSALSCICDYCLPTVEHPYKCFLVYMWLLPSYCGTSILVDSS